MRFNILCYCRLSSRYRAFAKQEKDSRPNTWASVFQIPKNGMFPRESQCCGGGCLPHLTETDLESTKTTSSYCQHNSTGKPFLEMVQASNSKTSEQPIQHESEMGPLRSRLQRPLIQTSRAVQSNAIRHPPDSHPFTGITVEPTSGSSLLALAGLRRR
jgi:hypothetical protein